MKIAMLSLFVLSILATSLSAQEKTETKGATPAATPAALNFKMKSIDGADVDLSQNLGKVVLIVNVASQCGLTPQYADLQALHEKYAEKGLVILGFPCNQFGGQEPGTETDIKKFCTEKYSVSFPMFSKIDVKGSNQNGLYKYLTGLDLSPKGKGDVGWNFEKFLLDRSGKPVARFASKVKPTSDEVEKAIVAALESK